MELKPAIKLIPSHRFVKLASFFDYLQQCLIRNQTKDLPVREYKNHCDKV